MDENVESQNLFMTQQEGNVQNEPRKANNRWHRNTSLAFVLALEHYLI